MRGPVQGFRCATPLATFLGPCRAEGRLDALARAQRHARQYAWYLKMDVRKYFDSIPHRRLLALLERKIKDPAVLGLFEKIVGSYETRRAGCETFGLPIGSLSSQHLANFYLGGLDRLALEALKTGGYVRYMDDFVLWHGDKDWLKAARDRIVHFMDTTLGLSAKPEPYINRSAHGMDFLGLRVFPHTLRLNARSKLRFLRKLRRLEEAHEADEISSAALQQRATCLVDFTLHADSHGFRHSAGIWKEEGSRRPARTVCCVAGRGTTTRTTRVFPTATGTTRPTGTTTTDSALPKLSLAVVGSGGLLPPPCPGVTRWLSCPAVDAAGKENEPVRCQ